MFRLIFEHIENIAGSIGTSRSLYAGFQVSPARKQKPPISREIMLRLLNLWVAVSTRAQGMNSAKKEKHHERE
jgi:hypothetical protein